MKTLPSSPRPLGPALVVPLVELLGGLAILMGAYVALTAVPLIATMLVAMFSVHFRYGFSSVNTIGLTAEGPVLGPPGYEINLLYVAGLIALALGGAGLFSVDALVARWRKQRS